MCCFSRPVTSVKNTNIFARASKNGRQFLVYNMTLTAREDLAMILPVPVAIPARENAVRFINLQKYPEFFADLQAGFPVVKTDSRLPTMGASPPQLQVISVGDFIASFVPAIKDFGRLDSRFRLPTEVWSKLPQYKTYGFVVFQLKRVRPGERRAYHPMAFEFPRANPNRLFFPTVHIHDGKVHPTALFDHALYLQRTQEDLMMKWRESPQPAGLFMNVEKAHGLLDPEGHCYQMEIRGRHKNADILV